MAARRGRKAAEEPPPPPPEPEPEPEPPKEPEPIADTTAQDDLSRTRGSLAGEKAKNVPEKIIERIIICPGGNPYMQQPMQQPQPQTQGVCHCPPPPTPEEKKKKKKKGKKKKLPYEDEDQLCQHPYCIVQRRRVKPDMTTKPKPTIVVCHRPVVCKCEEGLPKCCSCQKVCGNCGKQCCSCGKVCCSCEDSGEDSDDNTSSLVNTDQYISFMNMVFAAANVMNERPDVF